MPVVSVFSAEFCHGDEVAQRAAEALGYRFLSAEVIERAAQRSNATPGDIARAMLGPAFVFNKFTHRRERYVAHIRAAVAELLQDGVVFFGPAGQLIPRNLPDVLRVCVLADPAYRAAELSRRGMDEKEAAQAVREKDARLADWTQHLFGLPPWDRSLYDVKIPMNATSVEAAAKLVCDSAARDALKPTDKSRRAAADFRVGAEAAVALAEAGYYHQVECAGGTISVVVDQYVLSLDRLEGEVKKALSGVAGVTGVKARAGAHYRPPAVFAPVDFEMPSKVLLVDDEKDFVLTLSERLEMRDVSPAIALDGEQALKILDEEEPDVIVLDLKMPGIDGIEVLRKVKTGHPAVEVIILTGHGNEKDREVCMRLGAFAYLQKPVNIETLSKAMKDAYEKIRSAGSAKP
jgi:CheY-like chemotaxis protein